MGRQETVRVGVTTGRLLQQSFFIIDDRQRQRQAAGQPGVEDQVKHPQIAVVELARHTWVPFEATSCACTNPTGRGLVYS